MSEEESPSNLSRKSSFSEGELYNIYSDQSSGDELSGDEIVNEEELIQLLDSDQFVTNLRRGREAFMQALCVPAMIKGLIRLCLSPVSHIPVDDLNRRKRLPHIAFQTLLCDPISESIVNNYSVLGCLVEFIEQDEYSLEEGHGLQQEEPPRTGYFAKLCEGLIERFPTETIACFSRHENLVPALIKHVGDSFIMDFVFKLVDCGLTHNWLKSADLLGKLILRLNRAATKIEREQITHVLVNVLTLCHPWNQSALVKDILSRPDLANSIITYVSSTPIDGLCIKQGLGVLIALFNLVNEEMVGVPVIIQKTINELPFFVSILRNNELLPNEGELALSFGSVKYLFTSIRLRVVEMMVSLLYTGYVEVVEKLNDAELFNCLMELLVLFPWNNIFHHQLVQIFSGLLCSTDETIVVKVLSDCKLIHHIIDVMKSDFDTSKIGYVGHLHQISIEIMKAAKYNEKLANHLVELEGWSLHALPRLEFISVIESQPLGGEVANDEDLYSGDEDFMDKPYELQGRDFDNLELAYEDADNFDDFDTEIIG